MKIKEIDTTSAIAWSSDAIPLLATGSIAGSFDFDKPSAATLQIWNAIGLPHDGPVFSAEVEHKFHALAWLHPLEGRPRGVLVGAFANSVLEFWDVDTLFRTASLASASIHKSSSDDPFRCLQFNPHQPHVLAVGGLKAQILIWDVLSFAEPVPLGKPMSPMDQITLLAWNNTHSYILASTSTLGYTSIWDLKQKKEVLHLLYAGVNGKADFSHVTWHPKELTKLATASQSDTCPLVMTWNLRTPQEPEKIMHGHTKGVLSLDWCAQDPNLLISAGKDNCTRLWNPVLGLKLGEYPTTANWAFMTKFAPRAPDIFVTASFDGKVIVQTLQDTSPPVSEKVQASDDNEFWSSIPNVETQQAVFEVKQAPEWLKCPVSVSFGFGSKMVVARNQNGHGVVEVKKYDAAGGSDAATNELSTAFTSNNFSSILENKLLQNTPDISDWRLLGHLAAGQNQFLSLVFGFDGNEKSNNSTESNINSNRIDDTSIVLDGKSDAFRAGEDDFFSSLSSEKLAAYIPTGNFSIAGADAKLAKLILHNKIPHAVDACLQSDQLVEALVLALDQNDTVKNKVRSHYFLEAGDAVLPRLIYSAASRDVADIVLHADLASWKDIAASIRAYCPAESSDYNSKFVQLGDRILTSSGERSRENALHCYLAGSALDKVAILWLQELPGLESQLLQDGAVSNLYDARYLALNAFTQKVTVYRSILNATGPVSGSDIEPLCKAVADFSSMATANGNFELASHLMSLLPDDYSGVKVEKERIAQALQPSNLVTRVGVGAKARGSKPYSGYQQPLQYGGLNQFGAQAAQPLNQFGRVALVTQAQIPKPAFNQTQFLNQSSQHPSNLYAQNPYANRATSTARGPSRTPRASVDHTAQGAQQVHNPYVHSYASQGYGHAPGHPQVYGMPQGYGANGTSMQSPTPQRIKPKSDTEGWNDLPEAFKASAKPAPRRTPGPQSSPQQGSVTPVLPPANPQLTRMVSGPPPPPAMNNSRSRRTSNATEMSAGPPRLDRLNSKYAPPPTLTPPESVPMGNRYGQFEASRVQQAIRTAPPKNPYAPAAQAAPKTPSAPPTGTFPYVNPAVRNSSTTSGAAPPLFLPPPIQTRATPLTPPTNPYGPPVRSGTPRSHTPHSAFNPPPLQGQGQVQQVQGQIQQAQGQVQQAQGQGQIRASYAPAKARVNPYAPEKKLEHASSSVGGPPKGPPLPSGPPSEPPQGGILVTPGASAPPPRYAPSASTPNASAPPQASAPPSAQAKVHPQPANPPARAPSAKAPPHHHPQAPLRVTTQPNGPQGGAPGQQSAIQQDFTSLLASVKQNAPAKFSKHVADMEKRLNMLYGHLQRGDLVSPGTVALLHEISQALMARDYQAAAGFNREIMEKYSGEVGEWNVGVKRLITMSEATKDNSAPQ